MAMEVFLIAAMTLDGYIGRSETDRSFDWTTPEDKAEYVAKIKQAQHLVLGAKTLKTVQKFPLGTVCHVYTRQPLDFKTEGLSSAASYLPTNAAPEVLVAELVAQGVSQLAVCGGASIYQQFLAAGVVTKIYLTVEPILFGSGIKLFGAATAGKKLQLVSSRQLNDSGSLWLEYSIEN